MFWRNTNISSNGGFHSIGSKSKCCHTRSEPRWVAAGAELFVDVCEAGESPFLPAPRSQAPRGSGDSAAVVPELPGNATVSCPCRAGASGQHTLLSQAELILISFPLKSSVSAHLSTFSATRYESQMKAAL